MIRIAFGILALVGAIVSPAASQTVYYVDSAGNDNNLGTAASPFASIQKGLNVAQPGDVVEVLDGVYRITGDGAYFTRSGSADAPITLRAAAGADVLVKGSEVVTDWAPDSGSIYRHTGWSHYYGTWKENPSDARDMARNQLFVDGQYVEEVPSLVAMRAGTFYIDKPDPNVSSYDIYLWLTDGGNPSTRTVEASAATALLKTNNYSNLSIQGLQFEHCANMPQDNAAVRVTAGSNNVLVENIRVQYAAGAGITIAGTGNVLRQSQFNHNGQLGVHSGSAVGLLVQHCETAHNNTLAGKQFSTGWEAGGNKFSRSTGVVIDGLVSHHNRGSGIWFDIDNHEATITNCVAYENLTFGIHYEISYTARIYNNLVFNNRYIGTNMDAPDGNGIYLSSSAGCEVFNNTIVGNENYGISSSGPLRDDGSGRNVYSYANDIFNNVVAWNHSHPERNFAEIGISNVDPATQPDPSLGVPFIPFALTEVDYNLYYGENPNWFCGWPWRTFARWQAGPGDDPTGPGQDPNGMWADPLFLDLAAGDFRLDPNSPAWGAGRYVEGVFYSQDIGAYFDHLPPPYGVPEPQVLGMLACAALACGGRRWCRRRRGIGAGTTRR